MNIVYLLTNIDKKEGEKRFYIGAKSECRLEVIEGLPTIIDIKTERPYLGSATCHQMKQDLIAGHSFSACILKEVNRKDLLATEDEFIMKSNAVESEEYYNRGRGMVAGFDYDQDAIINFFGEVRKDFNSSKSGISKRNATAKRFGFKNLGEFAIWIHKEKLSGLNSVQISAKINCERHVPNRFIESYNMKKCVTELNNKSEETQTQVRELYVKGASYHKISEITGLEIPTVSIYMNNFDGYKEKDYLVARRKNLTDNELQVKIIELYLKGYSLKKIAKDLGVNSTYTFRSFDKYVREFLPKPTTH